MSLYTSRPGGKRVPTFTSYEAMRQRCRSKTHKEYFRYKNISICERWLEGKGQGYRNFIDDLGLRPEGMTLDRIDNTKGYNSDNCRWANKTDQSRNQRTRISNESGYKGVSWSQAAKKWRARLQDKGKQIYLGIFDCKIDAAIAYNLGVLKYWGKGYPLNNVCCKECVNVIY